MKTYSISISVASSRDGGQPPVPGIRRSSNMSTINKDVSGMFFADTAGEALFGLLHQFIDLESEGVKEIVLLRCSASVEYITDNIIIFSVPGGVVRMIDEGQYYSSPLSVGDTGTLLTCYDGFNIYTRFVHSDNPQSDQ